MKFNHALEKAMVIIDENTYTQKQVDKAVKELKNAYDNLLDLTQYGRILQSSLSSSLNDEQAAAFDKLLREALSNRIYVDGRSQELNYRYYYQQIDYNKNAKQKRLQIKSNALNEFTRQS